MELKVIAQLPIGLYDEVASGTESLSNIFAKYGYDDEFATKCINDRRFQVLVNERKAELEKTGELHVRRALAVNDMTLTQIAKRVMDPHTPTPVLLSIYQSTAKIAKLEPGPNVAVAQGSGFSISIHLDGGRVEKEVKSIHVEETCIENGKNYTDDLGETPAHIQKMVQELEYKE